MKTKTRRFLMSALALASGAMLAGCGGDGAKSEAGSGGAYSSRIYMLVAGSGQLSAGAGGAVRTLTLKNVEPDVLWYAGGQGVEVGKSAAKEYAGNIWRDAYDGIDPNATVQFQLSGGGGLEGVYVVLSRPAYDEKTRTMTFQAQLQNDTLDQDVDAALDFDNVTVRVLNNLVDDKEVAEYTQYASKAALQPTATAGQYKVVLSQAGEDMFLVDNAPGTYSEARPVSYFLPQWSYAYGETAPAATLFGTTAKGDPKLYAMTLSNPAYDADTDEISYTATLRGSNAGAPEALGDAVLSVAAGRFTRFPIPGKGTAYQAFGQGYNPSTANTSYIYFGSDIARKQAGSLWGKQSYLSQSCGTDCRNDLKTIKDMGINLIRLYDWDTRNDHSQFLDYANSLNIKVVVPLSNWISTQGDPLWNTALAAYFSNRNFGNKAGTDWHPAIAGVIISNELDAEGYPGNYNTAIGLVARFIEEADKRKFSKSVPVGMPITFVPRGEPYLSGKNMPGWNQFNRLLTDSRTAKYKDRLMLAPQTYNDETYLLKNAESTGQGWIPATYKQFGVPILFTEIGYSRAKPDYTPNYVNRQLKGVLDYQKSNPGQILGIAHFQFDDKVWKQTEHDTDTEGAFGAFHHGDIVKQIQTVKADYDFYDDQAKTNYGVLTIDQLVKTSLHDAVVDAYK
ncbi:MAG: hypothetical protein E2576_06650 [Alcaligenaceae bacterium]|nr:hypothetical protein [Alcaligenaceae bacterium SAGV5]MPS53402.1 hypothetical protein [Alcaligenaceae bacterium SAGV3]MPT56390.1 hypothetical protein [Alcaligenaceae bacterium]